MKTTLLTVHVAGGTTALLSMLIPLLSRKGGTTHRRAGWVFVAGMTTVSTTALILSALRLMTDRSPAGRPGGALLFYIAILTGAAVSAGMRVLRAKHRTTGHRHPWDMGIATVLTAGAILLAAYGIAIGQALLISFAIIGLISGSGQLAYWMRPPSHPMHWWFEHMNQMLGGCISAVTAFLVNNAARLGLPNTSLLVWLMPAAIGVPATVIWIRYYRRGFSRKAKSGTSPRQARAVATAALLLAVASAAVVRADGQRFDVASVRPNTSDIRQDTQVTADGLRLTHWALRPIIQLAFGVDQPSKLAGVPSWAESDRWDVVAKIGDGSRGDTRQMLRSLLEERFKLRTHVEQRHIDVYRLVVLHPDRGPLPALHPSSAECLTAANASQAQPPDNLVRCGPQPAGPGRLVIVGSPVGMLAGILSLMVGRPVLDDTGLTGRFDFEVTSASDAERAAGTDGPSIFTALQEQLGLKLEAGKQDQEVLVIDRVERPDPD